MGSFCDKRAPAFRRPDVIFERHPQTKIKHLFRALFPALLLACAAVTAVAADIRTVRHVSDGDTLVLENGEKVRLIGVDTPEMSDRPRNRDTARRNKLDEKTVSAFAKKAKTYTEGLVTGRSVRLEYDWQRTDKYERTLAYVYREEDGLFLNAEIIRQGYGLPIVYFPFKYKEDFQKLRDQAREGKRGLWQSG